MLKESIRYQLMNGGADLVGFADISGLNDPAYQGFSTAISIGVKLFDSVIDTITHAPTHLYLHHYETVNKKIDSITLSGGVYLENLGYKALPIAASQSDPNRKEEKIAFFSHKTAARLSGLGHIGRSALMVTRDYGPRVRFGTLLTNLLIEHDTPMLDNLCGACTACVQACPAQAIKGNLYEIGAPRDSIYDAFACHDHIKKYFSINGGGKVCGICIQRCPLGKAGVRKWSPDTETSYNDF